MFSMPGGSEWLIILLVVMVLFGGKKIPEVMEGLGKGIRSFKKAMNEPDSSPADRISSDKPATDRREPGA
ncbi:MAG: twin-arginine translocase TatA/TatE family subunit [Deltaproteobacteria bacterium]|nr:twin-arginine translocase TatA/TatE family subunit [Deltaproteobacteria bacterium]